MPNNDAPNILQLLGSNSDSAFHDSLVLTRHCFRQERLTLVAGPLNRVQQEQVALTGARWVNLALADYPTYDATKPLEAEKSDLISRAMSDVYEPGSVEKVLTMAALIEAGANIIGGCCGTTPAHIAAIASAVAAAK